jgi:hypothetical protein
MVSKLSMKGSYLEIFAEFLSEFVEGVKESEAQWYSSRPLPNDIPSLADLLGVSAENLQGLFFKCRLEKIKIDKKICCFHASNFESFVETISRLPSQQQAEAASLFELEEEES